MATLPTTQARRADVVSEHEFGGYIRQLREARGLSLRGGAKTLGIGHMRLDELERGVSRATGRPTRPTRELAAKIAEVYGLPRDSLLELAGYAREQLDLAHDEQLVVTLMRRMDAHHRALTVQLVQTIDRAGGPAAT